MPPFVPRKRRPSTPPQTSTPSKSAKKAKLTETLDADPKSTSTVEANRKFSLGDDSQSSLSDIDSDEFEDISLTKKNPTAQKGEEDDDEDQDEDIDWEDAVQGEGNDLTSAQITPRPITDINISMDQTEDYGSLTAVFGSKKGPTKIERQVRMDTHKMHVQFLLFHNLVRNAWLCDTQLQQILVSQLPVGIMKEVDKWRVASGLSQDAVPPLRSKSKGKKRGRKSASERNERDWGQPSQRLEEGRPDMSRGDPLHTLLKVLTAYWKKRFRITAPGLRKYGYRPTKAIQAELVSFQRGPHDPETYGEKISNIEELRELAKKCEGSRDVGAQLFTALLRGLGIESRMVANLQPIGFGWTKNEEGKVRKPKGKSGKDEEADEDFSEEPDSPPDTVPKRKQSTQIRKGRLSKGNGGAESPIALDESEVDDDSLQPSSEDDSIVDVTPVATKAKPSKKYDKDLPYPIYWTEALSPVTSKVIPVDPLILMNVIAITEELLPVFEPRGAKAEKAKQIMGYVISYSTDGTAKDTTTRYLKRHTWPGKTKGVRVPIEKIPVYNRRGKVKRYEAYDWFKETMSGYRRPDKLRTTVDDLEDSTDLVPRQPEKKDIKDEGDTLQSLRASAEFVLERFLRREEAIRPDAEPVRMFSSGKGDKAKEEKVFRRSDVERCLTAESWHKEGRKPKFGEVPMKLVPVRAVTLTRKREIEDHERETGEKAKQGLYSWDQTEYIIPPPIKDGKIPKNAYGNIDCFVATMVPKGAVHIPLRGTVRICKRLEIDYAEAVTGFEFGNKRAVPVITGVVVAEENEHAVIDAWEEYSAMQRKKEEGKQVKAILALWRKFLMGLRITARLQEDYGGEFGDDQAEASNPLMKREPAPETADKTEQFAQWQPDEEEILGGGFFLPGEDDEPEADLDELVVDHDVGQVNGKGKEDAQYPTPVSMSSSTKPSQKANRQIIRDVSSSDLSELGSIVSDASEEVYKPSKASQKKLKATQRRRSARKTKAAITSPYFGHDEED